MRLALTLGAGLIEGVIRDWIRAVRRFQIGPETFWSLDGHLHTVLKDRHREHVRWIGRAP